LAICSQQLQLDDQSFTITREDGYYVSVNLDWSVDDFRPLRKIRPELHYGGIRCLIELDLYTASQEVHLDHP